MKKVDYTGEQNADVENSKKESSENSSEKNSELSDFNLMRGRFSEKK